MNTRPFEYYFSRKELLKILCRKRAVLAKKEHDKLFHKRLLLERGKQSLNGLYDIFPSRNQCIRLTKKERLGKSALEINALQLERTVLRLTDKFKKIPTEIWEVKLYKFLDDLSKDIVEGSYSIPKPDIIHQFKEKKQDISIFRPIAYFKIKDRIKISQISKYLTECFDPTFENCSYAFRSTRVLKKSYSHHSAVKDIIDFKDKRYKDQNLWVSECDIKKFYDCVNHKVVKEIFQNKVIECKNLGLNIDERAINLFYSYLKSYSFNFDVRTKILGKKKEFGWVKEEELAKVGSNPKTDKIGVPQGGAISCLIANLLMDVVDKKVISINDGNQFYARFCDDMVLLHPNELQCKYALKEYEEGLKEIKLLNHPFTNIEKYDKDFWKSKSKSPYTWGRKTQIKNVPWLSFVGYQVSYDLKIRVRKASLRKEIEKQVKETGKVISKIKDSKSFRVSERSIKRRVKQRLLSMSVGRINIFDMYKPGTMCWTSGFKLMKEFDNVQFQSKHLDRKRVAQFVRLEVHIRKMDESQRPPVTRKSANIDKDPNYYGSPFSYHFQFK
jgi:hypothetical protein